MATVEKITIALPVTPSASGRSDGICLGFTAEDLRVVVQEGIDSGPSSRSTMAVVKAAARERLESSRHER